MRTLRLRWLLVPVLLVTLWSACGGTSVSGGIDPTGGEICLPDGTVCFVVPPGGLADYEGFKISPMNQADVPAGALSSGYDISPTTNTRVTFLKPARVVFSLELVDVTAVPNENLLRIYTIESNDAGEGWQPLANSFVDRVRLEISGEVSHLSPFIVLRSDRLPDGGVIVEGDAGMKPDSGMIVVPPIPDAGRPDAGQPDAGQPEVDAGQPDAGTPDAGTPDAGQPDAGPPDAGQPDAGPPDAGQPDAGQPDAGQPDAGPPDAGQPDAGQPDAGEPDAGDAG